MILLLSVIILINIIAGFKYTVDVSIAYSANPDVSVMQLNNDTKISGLVWITTMTIITGVFLFVGNQWL